MDRRLTLTAGLAAFALAVIRLGRLFETEPGMPEWAAIAVASALLGGLVWWLLSQLVSSTRVALGIHGVLAILLLIRVSVPATLIAGVLPSPTTPGSLGLALDQAMRIIRFGVPPVPPAAGVLAVVAIVMWVVGSLFAWGVSRGPALAIVVPPIILYLQFAVFDNSDTGLGWTATSATMLALAISALALQSSRETGRARDHRGSPLPKRSPALALVTAGVVAVVAVGITASASGLVSEYGNLPWRSGGTGYGTVGGGVTFNRLVGLRQRIISRSNQVLFRATLGEGAPPPNQIYWRMETLDRFDGEAWSPSGGPLRNYEPGQSLGDPRRTYRGTTTPLLQLIRIEALRGELIPVGGLARSIQTAPDGISLTSIRVTSDTALLYPPGLRAGDTIQVEAVLPLYKEDLGVLATGPDGQLTPLFANAAQAGLFTPSPAPPSAGSLPTPDLDYYTSLPDNLPSAIVAIARQRTEGATTDFERAWMLQYWFRDSGDFTYSTRVSTGHSALRLEKWLADPESRNYRVGYCEQFAASMAVLGRALGIPSRVVWGFTPGTVVVQNGVEVIEVRDTNAHAWVEMWMEGVGWVQFDPTPRGEFQPESITAGFDPTTFVPEPDRGSSQRAPELAERPDPSQFEDPLTETATPETLRWWLILVLLAPLPLMPPALKALRRHRRMRRIRTGAITPVWDEIVDRLVDLREPVPAGLTPLELATRSDPMLVPVAMRYSAAIYGGRTYTTREEDLETVDRWLRWRYPRLRRLRAALTPRSLLRRP